MPVHGVVHLSVELFRKIKETCELVKDDVEDVVRSLESRMELNF